MSNTVKTFDFNETATGKVNFQKLNIELATSIVPADNAEGIKGKIFVFLIREMDANETTALQSLINNHDGAEAKAFNHTLVQAREDEILRMNQMGIYHQLIDDDQLVRYLTKIDNALNGWKRSANPVAVLEVIFEDAGVSDIAGTPALQEDGITPVDTSQLEFYNFLHTVSNPVTGSKVFQFVAGTILAAS